MKAVLVMTSFVTRVIVNDDATEAQIIERAMYQHLENVPSDFGENIEEIIDDEEVPYDPELSLDENHLETILYEQL